MFAQDGLTGLNEACGLFGIWGHKDAVTMTYYGIHALQHRGQEGAGIVAKNERVLSRHFGLGLVADVFTRDILETLTGTAAIGHAHYAAGERDIINVQPFLFHFKKDSLALCHNGAIINAAALRDELEAKGNIFHTNSDSEILAHLIKHNIVVSPESDGINSPSPQSGEGGKPIATVGNNYNGADFVRSVKKSLRQLTGGFAYLLLTQDMLVAARDPGGIRPLSIGRLGGRLYDTYVAASETCAFDVIGAEFLRDVEPGEIVIIDNNGLRSEKYTDDTCHSLCSMEYVYFARPDADMAGANIHTSRKNMGKILAREAPVAADVVTGIPDSAISAAIGYAEAAGIPYEMGLIKNRYVGRTFIRPSQEMREQGVKMKLSAVRGVVEGKRVVLIDDSIVRGTTAKRIVSHLRNAGATEVHMRIASPPLIAPCRFGIDIQTEAELMASKCTLEEMQHIIGADTLAFLSEDGIKEAVGLKFSCANRGLCLECFGC